MRLYLSLLPDRAVFVEARAESPGVIGDLRRIVHVGERFLGVPYAVLARYAAPDGDGAASLEELQQESATE